MDPEAHREANDFYFGAERPYSPDDAEPDSDEPCDAFEAGDERTFGGDPACAHCGYSESAHRTP